MSNGRLAVQLPNEAGPQRTRGMRQTHRLAQDSAARPAELMQPPDASEPSAMPSRPPGTSCAKTVLAGGRCRGSVRRGQSLSYRLKTGETETRSKLAS